LKQLTLHRGPTIQTKMSLVTAGIYCTISANFSGAMEDCSIVRVQQLQCFIAEGAVCPHHNTWLIVKHRRQDSSHCVTFNMHTERSVLCLALCLSIWLLMSHYH